MAGEGWRIRAGFMEGDRWVPFFVFGRSHRPANPALLSSIPMKAGHGLLGAAVTLFLVVVSVRATGVGAQNAPGAAAAQSAPGAPAAQTASSAQTHYPAVPPGTTSADYIGSNN